MTKYVFGLLFFPAFLVYAIYKKQLWGLLKRGSTWLAALVVLAPLSCWLYYIERQLPGFLEQALGHEITERYAVGYGGHDHPFNYYFLNFWEKDHFIPWLLLLPVPLFLVFSRHRSTMRDFSVLMFLCVLGELLVVSFSKTKTDHYDMVAYPPLAMLAGIGLYQLALALLHLWKEKMHRPIVLSAVVLGGWWLVALPYCTVMERVYKPKMTDITMGYGYLLQKIQETRPSFKSFTILSPIYNGQVNYYAGLLSRKEGYKIKLSEHPKWVEVGDTVLVCEPEMKDSLIAHFDLQAIEAEGACFLAIAKGKKNSAMRMEDKGRQ